MSEGELDMQGQIDNADRGIWDGQAWVRAIGIHLAVAVVVLLGLFCTTHNRDVSSQGFERQYVETRVFQDRWNDLSNYWAMSGWWGNGGL